MSYIKGRVLEQIFREVAPMTQQSGPFFDSLAQLMTDAVGVAGGLKREVDTVVRSQAERFLADMDLVKREEVDVLKDLIAGLRRENEALSARVAALESQSAQKKS